jgi:hypothetical protein
MAAAQLLHRAGGRVAVPTYLVPATQKVWGTLFWSALPFPCLWHRALHSSVLLLMKRKKDASNHPWLAGKDVVLPSFLHVAA